MKRKKLISLVILLIITISVSAGDKKTNFSGDWKLDREKTVLANSQLFLSKINFNMKNDSLLTVRTYENANGEQYPFNENLTMDGKEYKITIYDMPRKSKAYWSDNNESIVIESTTTFYGNSGEVDFITKENWMVDETGTQLKFDFTGKTSTDESKGTYYFKKAR